MEAAGLRGRRRGVLLLDQARLEHEQQDHQHVLHLGGEEDAPEDGGGVGGQVHGVAREHAQGLDRADQDQRRHPQLPDEQL